MIAKLTEGEILAQIRDLTFDARTVAARLSMRDEIKRLLEEQGLWS